MEIRPAPPDNQRLEHLELITTDYLFKRFSDLPEEPLTKLRASIVSKPSLAIVASRLGLGEALFMSNGEASSGGRERPSNLADVLEAVIGAIYLDSGLEVAMKVVTSVLQPEFEALDPQTAEVANSKGRLQEILHQITSEAPSYKVVSEEGPPHTRIFTSEVNWGGLQRRGTLQKNRRNRGRHRRFEFRCLEVERLVILKVDLIRFINTALASATRQPRKIRDPL